jgi:hypothetical protein
VLGDGVSFPEPAISLDLRVSSGVALERAVVRNPDLRTRLSMGCRLRLGLRAKSKQ